MSKQSENRSENKQHLGVFLLICLGSGLLGAALGLGLAFAPDTLGTTAAQGARWFCSRAAHFGPLACCVLVLVVFLPLYRRAKGLFSGWDGEDELVIEQAQQRLELGLLAVNVSVIVCYFLFGCSACALMENPRVIPISAGGMLAHLALIMVLQQKAVDLLKQINPEKKGSVYDFRFQKRWLDSCDESKRLAIYRSAFAAYKAVTYLCLGLWLLLVLISMFFSSALLAMGCVCLIWLVQTVVYCTASMSLGKTGSSLPR